MLDAPLIAASLLVAESVVAIGFAIAMQRAERRAYALRRALDRAEGHITNLQRALGDAFRNADEFRKIADELGAEIVAHRARERLIAAERTRAAARAARKKAKRAAMKTADAEARRQHTVQALANLHLRPRAEVVAEVRGRRSA